MFYINIIFIYRTAHWNREISSLRILFEVIEVVYFLKISIVLKIIFAYHYFLNFSFNDIYDIYDLLEIGAVMAIVR